MDELRPAELDLFLGGEDEEAQDLPSSLGAYHRYVISSLPDGRAKVVEETNDPDDDGYPDVAIYHDEHLFPSIDAALAYTGLSGIQPSGVVVEVELDGGAV